MMLPPGHGYHHLQQQQQQLYQQQGPQYMFSLSNNNNNAAGEAFLQRLGASRAAGLGPGSDGFVMDGISSSSGQVGPARPSGSGNENRSNSFIFWRETKEKVRYWLVFREKLLTNVNIYNIIFIYIYIYIDISSSLGS
jgi:hypothetical protein